MISTRLFSTAYMAARSTPSEVSVDRAVMKFTVAPGAAPTGHLYIDVRLGIIPRYNAWILADHGKCRIIGFQAEELAIDLNIREMDIAASENPDGHTRRVLASN